MKNFAKFQKAGRETGRLVLECKRPLVVNHFDADGLSSGGLVCRALEENGVDYDEQTIPRTGIFKNWEKHREIIVTDLGGLAFQSAKMFPDKEIIIIDHHPPDKALDELPGNVTHFNPHFYGFDGAMECSAATTAYFCFRKPAYAELAAAGAVGDMQDFGPGGGLFGLNRIAAEEGVRKGVVRIDKGLRLVGRSWKKLDEMVSGSVSPFLPGLAGDRKAASVFLGKNGFDKKKVFSELPAGEKERLTGLLAEYCEQLGGPTSPLVGEIYSFTKQRGILADAIEYAAVLNACGREYESQVGIQIGLGNTRVHAKAKRILERHEKVLLNGFLFARKKAVDKGNFFLVDARGKVKESVIGSVAGAVLASLSTKKPLVAMSSSPRHTKASVRALKSAGVDVGVAFKKAAERVGGNGGGHAVAAGATIPKGKEKAFLSFFVRSLKR